MSKLKLFYYFLPLVIFKFFKVISINFYNPIIYDFVHKPYGLKYKLNAQDRLNLVRKFIKIINNVKSATSLEVHLTIAKYLLSLPKSKNTVIVECGCYKGASSCSISIICKIIGKKLIIYDSFEGLPDVSTKNRTYYLHLKKKEKYKKGMYLGKLNEVKKNIRNYGEISCCIFRKGFFAKTLKNHKEKIQLAFLDVDLVSSTKICIKLLWKKIVNEGYIFTDNSCDMANVRIWFDNSWWKKNIGIKSPGYIGSGCGLPLNLSHSGLGYVVKRPRLSSFSSNKKFTVNL